MSSRLSKWERWLELIKQQLYYAVQARHIYLETMRAVVNNPAVPQRSIFWRHLQQWYADSLIMAIRRQSKVSAQGVSLARLLTEVVENPELLSRKHWRSLFVGHLLETHADRMFDRLAGVGQRHLPRAQAEHDLAELRRLVASCERYADKRIAHYDRGREPNSPTFAELNAALDELTRIVEKYYKLMTASEIATFLPIGGDNWKKVLQVAWVGPEERSA